ncbi:MAG: LysR substrate-binding domain-containing protein [Acetobacteraceae bacterium]
MNALPSPQQLRYLLTLAELGHFGRAAEACAVTQSTLSAGILALERQLDAAILDRGTGKHVVFTALGEEIVGRARKALAALEAVAEAASAARAPLSGPLRLGVIPTVGPFLLPKLMPVLRGAFPNLRLFVREDVTRALVDRLASNRLDLLLVALPCDCGDAETLAVSRDEFVVALPRGHRLAARARVSAAALAGERMLLLEDGHCLRDQALSLCGMAGEQEGFAATSLHTLAQMVAGGLGVTLLPRMAVDAGVAAGADVELRPLSGGSTWRTIGLAWRPRSPRADEYRALAPLIAPGG